MEGYLTAINYVDGARAKTGDVLFEIQQAPYEAQVKAVEAAVLSARAQLVQAEAEFNRVLYVARTIGLALLLLGANMFIAHQLYP